MCALGLVLSYPFLFSARQKVIFCLSLSVFPHAITRALLLAVAGLVFNNHTRRKYYVANYLTVGVSSAANIALGAWALTNVLHYKDLFNAIDFSVIASIVDSVPPAVLISKGVDPENLAGPYSTLWFDLVIPVFIILTLITLLNIANAVFKTILMSKEKQLLKEGA